MSDGIAKIYDGLKPESLRYWPDEVDFKYLARCVRESQSQANDDGKYVSRLMPRTEAEKGDLLEDLSDYEAADSENRGNTNPLHEGSVKEEPMCCD